MPAAGMARILALSREFRELLQETTREGYRRGVGSYWGSRSSPPNWCVLYFYYYGGLVVFVDLPEPSSQGLLETFPGRELRADGLLWMLTLP